MKKIANQQVSTKTFLCGGGGSAIIMLLFGILLIILQTPAEVNGAPFLLGNQMSSLSVIPRTEEQATALLKFLENNPQFGANSTSSRNIQVNTEEIILVPKDHVSTVSNGLEQIGFRVDNSTNNTNSYQIFNE